MAKIEIACFNLESAIIAAQHPIHRIEFCSGLEFGGTTPLISDIEQLLKFIQTEITLMIRPRGGDFVYNDQEFENMIDCIKYFKKYPINGFVFGILDRNSELDLERNQHLIQLAGEKYCVLHRAFDLLEDPIFGVEQAIKCGFHTILSSGMAPNTMDGVDNLKLMVDHAVGTEINIMCGGGIRSHNIKQIQAKTNANYFHSSAITNQNGIADAVEIKMLIENLV